MIFYDIFRLNIYVPFVSFSPKNVAEQITDHTQLSSPRAYRKCAIVGTVVLKCPLVK